MLGIPGLLMPESWQKAMKERRRHEAERRMKLAVPWDPNVKWEKELQFKADTYKMLSLFDVEPCTYARGARGKQAAQSPEESFFYAEMILPAGETLRTMSGLREGTVLFDGDVIVPVLHESDTAWDGPWMGLTPMEMMTLRPGTKRAKGRTIVAGLGLGHQLIEVSKRKQVKELILVEQSQELVDWILPRVKPHLEQDLTDVVVGDAEKVLQTMSADVALLDIYPRYGGNAWRRDQLKEVCPDIKFMWAWGAYER